MLYAIAALLVILVDQWVKYSVSGAIPVGAPGVDFIPNIISLVNVQNDGAAFGFLSGGGARIYFIILTGVFTLAVILALATNFIPSRLGRWSLALMTAGGISNCIDRVINGFVQDMFKIELFNFPVFNVADIFITLFCFFFIIGLLFGRGEPDYEDEFDEDDEEEDRPRRQPREKQPKPERNTRKARQAKYEEDYEQYKAARAARQQQAPQAPVQPVAAPQPVRQPESAPAYDAADPFAEWERANAAAGTQPYGYNARAAQPAPAPAAPQAQQVPQPKIAPAQVPQPQQRPASAPKPAAPKSGDMDFSLDDILAEFK